MSERLLLDFDAFFLEHRLCGDLNGRRACMDGVRRVWRADRAAGGDAASVVNARSAPCG